MSEFLWTCGNGTEFVTADSGYRLVVRRSWGEAGYEFHVAPATGADLEASKSGYRTDLREAFDAAELALASLLDQRNARNKLMVA